MPPLITITIKVETNHRRKMEEYLRRVNLAAFKVVKDVALASKRDAKMLVRRANPHRKYKTAGGTKSGPWPPTHQTIRVRTKRPTRRQRPTARLIVARSAGMFLELGTKAHRTGSRSHPGSQAFPFMFPAVRKNFAAAPKKLQRELRGKG